MLSKLKCCFPIVWFCFLKDDIVLHAELQALNPKLVTPNLYHKHFT